MTEFSALSTAAAGMEAQRAALDVDAHNVAAAETGAAFDRLVPRFIIAPTDRNTEEDGTPFARAGSLDDIPSALTDAVPASFADIVSLADADEPFVRFAGTTTERGHGVDAITEMVAVLNAQRAYEADASVFDAGKRLAERTIDVGRI